MPAEHKTLEDTSPARKKSRTNGILKPLQKIDYPHGPCRTCCITSSSDMVFSGARRGVKAFKKVDNQWTFRGEISDPGWDRGEMDSLGGPSALAVFEDKYLIVGDMEGNLTLYYTANFAALDFLEYPGDMDNPVITSIVVLDDKTFLAASLDGNLYVWTLEVASNEDFVRRNGPPRPHGGSAIRCCIRLTNTSVATGGQDNHVCIWKTETVGPTTIRDWTLLKRLKANEGSVIHLGIVERSLVSVHKAKNEGTHGEENRILVWDMDSEWEKKTMVVAKTNNTIKSVVPVSPGKVLYSSLHGSEVWSTNSWEYEGNESMAKGFCTICGDTYVFGSSSLEFLDGLNVSVNT